MQMDRRGCTDHQMQVEIIDHRWWFITFLGIIKKPFKRGVRSHYPIIWPMAGAYATVLWLLKQKCFGCLALNTFPHGFTLSTLSGLRRRFSPFLSAKRVGSLAEKLVFGSQSHRRARRQSRTGKLEIIIQWSRAAAQKGFPHTKKKTLVKCWPKSFGNCSAKTNIQASLGNQANIWMY